jgi:hypothetical protein
MTEVWLVSWLAPASVKAFGPALHGAKENVIMTINQLKIGDVYRLERDAAPSALLQVGAGGDCAVFLWRDGEDEQCVVLDHEPEFRVIVVQQSLRKECKKLGNFECQASLRAFPEYAEIGWDEKKKLVSLDDVDRQREVSDEEWGRHERLAFWSVIHVKRRLDGEEIPI